MSRFNIFAAISAVVFSALMAVAPLSAEAKEAPLLTDKAPVVKPIMDEDGLYHQSWSTESFLDLKEDFETAKSEGKRLVVVFEQRGCIYCKRFHEKVLAIKQVNDYVRQNYLMVQINLWGDKEVTDFDGKVMSEKALARRWGVINTPTALFFTDDLAGKEGKIGKDLTVVPAFYPGAFGPNTSYDMFAWVVEKGYEGDEPFQKYHARRLLKLRDAGLLN
ncbi:MAG: thioredoxin [Hyphomicrobiales bacterium]|nr:MAG: thioredoxin [Hyphomicrobiales bacterium]